MMKARSLYAIFGYRKDLKCVYVLLVFSEKSNTEEWEYF